MPGLITGEKTDAQLDAMREGGRLLASLFAGVRKQVTAGISELELSHWLEREIKALGAIATYKTPEVNFPEVVCISTNDEVQHCIPTDYRLQKGDVVNFDMVITYKNMRTDSGFTMVVDEEPSGDKKRLLDYTEQALYAGIGAIKGPTRVGDISAAVEAVLLKGQLGIVRELVGHGIGHTMHAAPDIPNYGRAGSGVLLGVGDTIAIEPISTLGGEDIVQEADGWTLRTRDGSLSAQFEHTVLITENGAEILTTL